MCLYGVVVSVLATSTKVRGFDPGQGNGFLRAIKIRSTPSFGWDIKPEVPGMNNRPVEAAVLRRQSHPIITSVPLFASLPLPHSLVSTSKKQDSRSYGTLFVQYEMKLMQGLFC
jgi:hypothetical protein